MKDNRIFLGFGSNINPKIENILYSYELLRKIGIYFIKKSSFYSSKAYGFEFQDDFVNSVCEVRTNISAYDLLHVCQKVEIDMHRIRQFKWGPRNIDIDILLFGDETYADDELVVPHYDIKNRLFFLAPIREIAGNIEIAGERIDDLISNLHGYSVSLIKN